jgi:hypothetical protein
MFFKLRLLADDVIQLLPFAVMVAQEIQNGG